MQILSQPTLPPLPPSPASSSAPICTRTPPACQEPLGNHFLTIFPVSWIVQKKKKNQTSCPSHCGETHEILSCFFCCCCCFKPKSIQLCKIPGKSVPVGKKELYLSAVSLLRSCSFLVYLCQTCLLPSAYSVTSIMSSSLQLYDCNLSGSSVYGILQEEYWSGLPFPSPGDLSNPGIEPGSPGLAGDSLPLAPTETPSAGAL